MKTNQAVTVGPKPGFGPSPAPRTNRRRPHISTARAALLGVLIDQPEPCTVTALSTLTRQHPNTIREHLDGLVDERLAVRTRAPAMGRGRPAWLYSAAPKVGSEPGAREYAGLASALAAQITRTSQSPREDSIESGRIWGRDLIMASREADDPGPGEMAGQVTASDLDPAEVAADDVAAGVLTEAVLRPPGALAARLEVVGLLEALGFAPKADTNVGVVRLNRCPLLEAAHRNPEVVCGVHLGVVRGALEALGADPERTERVALQPFSEPGACRLDMLTRRAAATAS